MEASRTPEHASGGLDGTWSVALFGEVMSRSSLAGGSVSLYVGEGFENEWPPPDFRFSLPAVSFDRISQLPTVRLLSHDRLSSSF